MNDMLEWYQSLATPLQILVWVLILFLGFSLIKRMVKVAIVVFVLIVLIFAGLLLL